MLRKSCEILSEWNNNYLRPISFWKKNRGREERRRVFLLETWMSEPPDFSSERERSYTVSSIGVVQRGLRVRVPRARVCPLRRVNARPDRVCACVRACLARARSAHPHATPGNRGVLPRIVVHVEISWPWCCNNFKPEHRKNTGAFHVASHPRVRHPCARARV